MPTMLSWDAVLIWFLVGLLVGVGWTLGGWVVGRLLAKL